MATTIVNPTGKTVVFGTGGAAISGQPTNDKSTFVSGGLSQDNATSVAEVSAAGEPNSASRNLVGYLDKQALGASAIDAVGSGQYSLYAKLTDFTPALSEPLKKGDFILTDLGYVINVISGGTANVVLDILAADILTYFTSTTSGVSWKINKNAVKKTREGQYIYIGTPNIAGVANDAIQGGFTAPNRSSNHAGTVRTVHTAAQVRAGSWNPYNGSWDTAPTGVNDTTIFNSANDKAYQTGRVTFSNGNTTTTTDL